MLKSGPQCCRFDVGVGWHVCKVGNRFAALEPIAQGLGRLYGSVEADVARGLALRMDHGSQYLSDHFLNQLRYWGIHPSFAFVEEPETNGVVERWNRTLKEQAVYGRVFRNLAEVRAAVAAFVERYNQCQRAAEILEAARSLGDGRSPFVFASQGGKPFSITRLPRLLQNLKIAAVPHGFRSSFRDWAAEETNHPREVVEAALAHVVGNRTEAAYARSDLFERRRRLMDEWAAYLDG